jgi:predicted Fe-Mo cluster-binding NifX family protein
MKIAISTDGKHVSGHFGRCPSFTIVEIEEDKIKSKEIIDNPGHHPGFIPEFLHEKGVDCIVAGGMGRKAEGFFKQYGIETVVGIKGTIEETLKRIQNGTLENRESLCSPGLGKGYGIGKTEKQEEEQK